MQWPLMAGTCSQTIERRGTVRASEIKRWPSVLAAILGALLPHALPFGGSFLGFFLLRIVDRLQRALDDFEIC
jgi:hypothetical protein